MTMRIVLLFLIMFSFAQAAEKLSYKTFYLGINPNSKIPIIKDFMSPKGKMYKLPNGSLFVKDKKEVLDEIDKFLKFDQALLVPQVRVSFRNLKISDDDRLNTDISFKYKKGQGGSVKIKGQKRESQSKKNQITNITTQSGSPADITIYKSQDQLKVYRARFVDVVYHEKLREGVSLWVKPVVHGKRVVVHLKSVYWAIIDNKRRVFETGELNTKVYSFPGRWQSIGGVTSSKNEKKRGNVFLSIEDQKSNSFTDFMLMTEVISLDPGK